MDREIAYQMRIPRIVGRKSAFRVNLLISAVLIAVTPLPVLADMLVRGIGLADFFHQSLVVMGFTVYAWWAQAVLAMITALGVLVIMKT